MVCLVRGLSPRRSELGKSSSETPPWTQADVVASTWAFISTTDKSVSSWCRHCTCLWPTTLQNCCSWPIPKAFPCCETGLPKQKVPWKPSRVAGNGGTVGLSVTCTRRCARNGAGAYPQLGKLLCFGWSSMQLACGQPQLVSDSSGAWLVSRRMPFPHYSRCKPMSSLFKCKTCS